ncbi:glycosyltransferase [Shigella sonnei]
MVITDSKSQCNELEKGYFNSGVLLINTLAWRQCSFLLKRCRCLLIKPSFPVLTYIDQDILNLIL